MSTPNRVHVASRARFEAGVTDIGACASIPAAVILLAAMTVGSCSRPVDVSYTGLDRPLDFDEPPPVHVGIVADTTGPGSDAGRAFADALREALEAHDSRNGEPPILVDTFDDRGTEVGVRASAARLERDPGAHVAVVQAGRGRAAAAAELAPRTVVICAGCEPSDAVREGVFVLAGADGSAAATAAASWIRSAMSGQHVWTSRVLAEQLRRTDAPNGFTRVEGSEPAQGEDVFRQRRVDTAQR